MMIQRYCMIIGKVQQMDLPITEEQLRWWKQGALVQDVFPHLSSDQREFLLSGLLPGQFEEILGPEPEN